MSLIDRAARMRIRVLIDGEVRDMDVDSKVIPVTGEWPLLDGYIFAQIVVGDFDYGWEAFPRRK